MDDFKNDRRDYKKMYDMSINKSLKEIEKKQKGEEDFFNKIGN